MAPTFRGTYSHTTEPVRAAVMILMYPHRESVFMVLIKRNEYDGPHSGQVSFPGGAEEAGDRTLEHTALRETREELGISEEIRVLGTLTPLHIPVSNFFVTPVVGFTGARPAFHPDPSEVQYLIEVPVHSLLDPDNRQTETVLRHGTSIEAPYYRAGNDKIWGATAMIMSEFLQLAARLQPHRC